jgi:ribonuclease HI
MLYAADIFLTPQKKANRTQKNRTSGQAIINKLATIQRRAAIMITGAMRTTATDTLDVLANLLPIHLLVAKHQQRAALRLATLPPTHPLHKPIANAARRLVKRHPTPLHNLMYEYGIKPEAIETIKAVRQTTKWNANVKTYIPDNTNAAIQALQNDTADIKVYTDGSGMDGKIGAAAVLHRNGRRKAHIRYRLGTQTQHTVYEGEAVGALLGIKLISKEWGVRSATLCIDNQAVIKATQLTKPSAGHYIIDALHEDIDALRKKHLGIHLRITWTLGHEGIVGNKQADEEAKKAITENSSNRTELPRLLKKTLPQSKSAVKWAFGEKLKRWAQKLWQVSPQYEQMKKNRPDGHIKQIPIANRTPTEKGGQHPNTAENRTRAAS